MKKNLRKFLALVLVVAMVFSISAISASAAFTDTTSTKYAEAIEVLSGIGVINGTTSTTFDPTGALTRESAAKIIAYMLLGPTNAALISSATSQKFADVAPTRWSAGYIEYCANLGIISGDGTGNFNPTGTLTTAAFTKMLLCALGYKADVEGLTGGSWANTAATLGVAAGVSDTSIAVSATAVCTREQAAQLAFKALTAKTVQYSGGSTITVGGVSFTTGATRSFVPGSTAAGANYDAAAGDGFAQFCETYFPTLKLATTSVDGNGITAHKWTKSGTDISGVYNSAVLLKSSSNGTSWASLTDVTNSKYIGVKPDTSGVTYFKNGAASNVGTITTDAAVVGNVISFYDTDFDGQYEVVCSTAKSVVKLAAAPVTSTNAAGDPIVTISSLGKYNVPASTLSGYTGLAKDDYILYWTSGANSVTYIEKATSVSGVVTSFNTNSGVKVDGTYHADSGLTAGTIPGYTSNDYVNTYTFYLDNSGAVIASVQSTAVAASNLVALASIAFVPGSGVSSTDGVQAKVVKLDGTTAVVNVASINGNSYVVAGTAYSTLTASTGAAATHFNAWNDATQSWGGWTAVAAVTCGATLFQVATDAAGANAKSYFGISATAATNSAYTSRFYFFSTTSSGAYALTSTAPAGYSFAALANAVITNGAPAFDTAAVANSTTVFIYQTATSDGTPVYTVYTGIANVPTTTAAPTNNSVVQTIVKDSAGIAKYVFAKVGSTTSAATDLIFFPTTGYTSTYDGGVVYFEKSAIVNGVSSTVRVADADKSVSGMYTSSFKSAAGIYTIAGAAVKTNISSNVGSVLVAGGTGYLYNSSTKAYYINNAVVPATVTELTPDSIALSALDTVYVKLAAGSTTTASVIYVMHAAPAPTSVTLAAVDAITIGAANVMTGGAATGYVLNTNDGVSVTAVVPANCTLQSMTINGAAYTNSAAYTVVVGTYTVQVIYTDNYSGALYSNTYTFTVAL